MSQEKQNRDEEKSLEKALSPMVNRLIDKNFENSGDKIATQIAPLIGGAIREQIKSQKDDIVDALYPVMGNMISKFVTKSIEELLNKINTQIQNGLSATAIKRKIKAKIKGVSETELLLQENSEAKIKAVLLIHKESGTLLAKVEDENNRLNDPDMLASMMTAIRSFVNDWVSHDTPNNELGEIEYGGNKIIIEASGSSYLAVIVEGAAFANTYKKIRMVFENIVSQYTDVIKSFNGSFDTFPKEEIKKELNKLLENIQEETKKSSSKINPLLYLIPLIFVLWMGYLFYNNYSDEKLQEAIVAKVDATPALLPFKIYVDVHNKLVTLTGKVPFAYHKNLLKKLISNIKEIKGIHNEIQVIPTLTDPLQVSSNIAYLLKGFNVAQGTNINYSFDYNKLTLFGSIANKKLKSTLFKELATIQGIKKIKDNIIIQMPKIDANIYFNTASTKLNKPQQEKLLDIIQKLQKSDTNSTLLLQAYSDMIGNKQSNKTLAQKRFLSIKDFLYKQHELTNPLEMKIFDTPPPGVNAKENPYEARRIEISLKKEQ